MVTNLITVLIAAFLVSWWSVTPYCGGDLNLTASHPTAVFESPNYPRVHNAIEDCLWQVYAPGNVAQLTLTCSIDILKSPNCSHAWFSFFHYDDEIILCGRKHISRNFDGSTNIFIFSSSMCINFAYRGVSCAVSYNPDDIPTCTTPVNPNCRCGEKVVPRIVGGNETSRNEYPWQAMLINKTSWLSFCGGSFILKQWVLSASHCIADLRPRSFLVALAEPDPPKFYSWTQMTFKVRKIIIHENFGQMVENNNDIALLKLAKSACFNQYTFPICLPFNYKYHDFTDNIGIITGWGLTTQGDDNSRSKVLKQINQKIIMPSKCTWFDGFGWSRRQITENMICALAQNGGAYRGDSGGPMVWKSTSSKLYFQVGVLSMVDIFGNLTNPAISTRVSRYVDWIVEKTGAGEEFCVKT